VIEPVGALAPTVEKGRLASRWRRVAVPTVVLAGVLASKDLKEALEEALVMEPTGALDVTTIGPANMATPSSRAEVVAPAEELAWAQTKMAAPTVRSWEATAATVTWMVVMVATISNRALPTVAELTATISRPIAGEVTMTKVWVKVDLGWIRPNQAGSGLK
jgi:hypothetical protein